MDSLLHPFDQEITVDSPADLFLRHRLQVVENLWASVLKQECGQELVDLLGQLRHLCSPEGQATKDQAAEVVRLIEQLDLNEAIRAARAFALYFQLINLVEQHYEQREQLTRSSRQTAPPQLIPPPAQPSGQVAQAEELNSSGPGADLLEKSWQAKHNLEQEDKSTFQTLFPYLRQQNVPPQQIQRLIDQLDIRLVFTAHPTEIVRHTIRDKQRRMAKILQQIDHLEENTGPIDPADSWEMDVLREQLTEEIRLWWRTDELHQFKPTVS